MEMRVSVNEKEVQEAFPGTSQVSDHKFKLLVAAVAKQKLNVHKNMINRYEVVSVKRSRGMSGMNQDSVVVFDLNPIWMSFKKV